MVDHATTAPGRVRGEVFPKRRPRHARMPDDAFDIPAASLPKHVGIITDGNRRWARAHGLTVEEGHRKGADRIKEISRHAQKRGVRVLTFWAFSTENWKRTPREVMQIMRLVGDFLTEMRAEMHERKVCLTHLGRKDRLPKGLVALLNDVEEETKGYRDFFLNVGLDYGGRDELLRAMRRMLDDNVSPGALDEKIFSSYLDTARLPFPDLDLVIRTSAEHRSSGFLPWQGIYAEWLYEPVPLPEFSPARFDDALRTFAERDRRFGGG